MKRENSPVGIIGAGRLGQAMARTAFRAGRPVVIANSRGPESWRRWSAALGDGASAGTVADAAASGIVVIAVPWASVPKALEGLRWNGQIVIDATNDFDPRDLDGRTSSEVVADLVGDVARREGGEHVGRCWCSARIRARRRPACALPVGRRRCEDRGERPVPGRGLLHHRPRRPDHRRRDATGRRLRSPAPTSSVFPTNPDEARLSIQPQPKGDPP